LRSILNLSWDEILNCVPSTDALIQIKVLQFPPSYFCKKMEADNMRNLCTAVIFLTLAGALQALGQGAPGDKCPTVPRDKWMSVEILQAKVEALGYVVRRARIDDGCHKVYITDKASGGEVEAYYNPATGELVQAKLGKKLK
jgi:hypothetical protein